MLLTESQQAGNCVVLFNDASNDRRHGVASITKLKCYHLTFRKLTTASLRSAAHSSGSQWPQFGKTLPVTLVA